MNLNLRMTYNDFEKYLQERVSNGLSKYLTGEFGKEFVISGNKPFPLGETWIVRDQPDILIRRDYSTTAKSCYQCPWCGSISPDDMRGNCLACGAPRMV